MINIGVCRTQWWGSLEQLLPQTSVALHSMVPLQFKCDLFRQLLKWKQWRKLQELLD